MRWDRLETILVAAAAAVAVAGIGLLLTRLGPWYYALRKPRWQPPDWAFGPAWTLIFTLAAWAGVVAWRSPMNGLGTIVLFAVNGVANVTWSLLFFTLHRPDWSLVEWVFLWFSVLVPIVIFAHPAPEASWLLVPYLLWVSFAGVLNLAIVRLNGPFRGT